MSHVHRLRLSDRIFFVSVNLRRAIAPFGATEYELLTEAIEASRGGAYIAGGAYIEFDVCGPKAGGQTRRLAVVQLEVLFS